MPEWKDQIRNRLADLNLDPMREAEIVEELAQHLKDPYEELVGDGVTEENAWREAIELLSDSDLLARELRRVERTVAKPIVLGTPRRTIMRLPETGPIENRKEKESAFGIRHSEIVKDD